MALDIDTVYRDNKIKGDIHSGEYWPDKPEIRALLKGLFGAASNPSIVKKTKAALLLVTPADEKFGGVVLNDPEPTNNGYWLREAGAWVFGRPFPDTFAKVVLSGSGTAQTGSVSAGVNPAGVEVFFAKVATPNTGPLTLSVNGGPVRQVINLAGNPLAAGEWTGMVMFHLNEANQYQLLIDAGAAAGAAASAASAGVAATTANNARIAAEAAASSVSPTEFPTRAAAMALTPASGPLFIRLAGYASSGDGGAALYKKVVSEPGHSGKFSITLADAAAVVWYEIAETVLRPEMFGQIGDNAAGDTAAWVALASVANSRTRARVVADGSYNIAGSTVVFDGSLTKITLRLFNAEFYQQTNLSKTLSFHNIPYVRVNGGYFEGRGGAAGEYDGPSSSYNGVAALYAHDCEKTRFDNITLREHAGGDIVVKGGRVRHFENIDSKGIGAPYIDPVGQGNQGNGSDFGIMCQPSVNTDAQLFLYEDTYINVRTFDHAFGVMSCATRVLKMRGCDIGPNPGQHNAYLIDCDGLDIQANTFTGPRQQCIKNQYENYAGLFLGVEWATGVAYTVGQRVRYQSNGYLCTLAHTSGGSFNSANFVLNPLSLRDGGIVSNNTFDGAGGAESMGFALLSSSLSDGRYIFTRGLICQGNIFRNFVTAPIYWDRALDCDLLNNTFDKNQQSSLLRDFRGRISGNTIRNSKVVPFSVGACGTVYYEENKHIDCGLGGANTAARVPSLTEVGRNPATQIPDITTTPKVKYRRNEIEYTGSEGSSLYLFFGQSGIDWEVTETRYSGSTQLGRVEGTVSRQFRNDFSGYNNSGQNEAAPTDAATLITNLRAKNVVK